jgi:L-aspartate oxidase
MHGANRLASNSLLEGLVVGGRAGEAAASRAATVGPTRVADPTPPVRRALPRPELQAAMTRHASVVRTGDGLRELSGLLEQATPRAMRSRSDFEDAALTEVAAAVAAAASARTETRGCHHRSDFPEIDPAQAFSPARRNLARVAVGC